jgi:hypothetical protein
VNRTLKNIKIGNLTKTYSGSQISTPLTFQIGSIEVGAKRFSEDTLFDLNQGLEY